jgi:hypothetical protein
VNVGTVVVVVENINISMRTVPRLDRPFNKIKILLKAEWRIPVFSCPRPISFRYDTITVAVKSSTPIKVEASILHCANLKG